MTKTHETIYRGTLSELAQQAANDTNFQRGEITLVVHGAEEVVSTVDLQLLKRAVELLARSSNELPTFRSVLASWLTRPALLSNAFPLLSITVPTDGLLSTSRPESRNEGIVISRSCGCLRSIMTIQNSTKC